MLQPLLHETGFYVIARDGVECLPEGDVVEAARSMVCLHGTDPATVYLSAWARVDGMSVPDLERALYEERTLVKHLAMRRTLFVFPRESLAFAQAGAAINNAFGLRALDPLEARQRNLNVDWGVAYLGLPQHLGHLMQPPGHAAQPRALPRDAGEPVKAERVETNTKVV